MSDRRIKVHLFGWGPVKHPMGDFDVTPEFYQNMKASFDFMTSGEDRPPRFPPILRQHTEDGYGYGKVVGLTDQGEESGATAEVELSPEAYKDWEAGKIVDWSPSFIDEFEDRHSDTVLKNFLRELSFVSVGHLMNTRIKSPAYSLQDGFVTTPSGGKSMENEEDKKPVENEGGEGATLDSLAAQIAALVELLSRQAVDLEDDEEKNLEDEEDKAKENESEDEEKKELAARLLGIERQLASERKERARMHLESIGLDSKSPAAKPLIELAATDRAAFDGAVKLMSDSLGKKTPKGFQDTEAGGTGFADIGSDGFRKLAAQAKQDGAKTEFEAISMMEKRGQIRSADPTSFTQERAKILSSIFQ